METLSVAEMSLCDVEIKSWKHPVLLCEGKSQGVCGFCLDFKDMGSVGWSSLIPSISFLFLGVSTRG